MLDVYFRASGLTKNKVTTIGACIPGVCLALGAAVAHAQVVTDGSLGAATTLSGPNFFIDSTLGQTRGGNLFHSFSTFNIAAPQSAFFNSNPGISNIIARVTGPSASQIDGLLSADANLYLLNPRGVLFGPNARLDVAGSFHASSADYLGFPGGERFFTSLGAQSALSIAAPTAFGFLDATSGPISLTAAIIEGAENRTLSFIGGDVTFDGARVALERGRIDLVATASAGEVRPTATTLDTSSFSAMGNLRLRQTLINPFGEEGTSIYIRAGQFVMENESLIVTSTTAGGAARTVDIDVDRLSLQGSGIATQAEGTGVGTPITIRADEISIGNGSAVTALSGGALSGGDINVETGSLTIGGGAFSLLGTGSASGSGGAGNLTVRANTIDIANGALSAVTASEGDAGDINLVVDRLSIHDGGAISSGTTSSGDGGVIRIDAREVVLESSSNVPLRATITATTNSIGFDAGHAGTIQLEAQTLRMRNGHISSSTAGPGDGGAIGIDVGQLALEQGASITSDTGVVSAFGPAQIYGRGGAISIDADSLEVLSGSRISASTLRNAAGGTVSIAGGTLTVDGTGANGAPTGITATSGSIQSAATGAGGSILVDVDELAVINGGSISANTFGAGDAGSVDVVARDVLVSDAATISAATFGQGADAGDANAIRIQADNVTVTNLAQITNASHGPGAAGRLQIVSDSLTVSGDALLQVSSLSSGANAGATGDLFIESDLVTISDGGINALNAGSGAPGSIAIRARAVAMDDAAIVSAVSTGSGNAGSIGINATDALHLRGFSRITTESQNASGGNIALLVGNSLVIHDSTVSTSVLGGGADGGNILLDSRLLLLDSGSIIAQAVGGNGGSIDIAADFVLRSAFSLIDASSQLGIDGPVAILGFDTDLNADIAALPSDFLDARQWLAQPCASRLGTNVSRFTVDGRDGAYRSPGDFAPSPLLFDDESSVGRALARLDVVGLKSDLRIAGCR
jgi:filamentous hemagglutinin family protein